MFRILWSAAKTYLVVKAVEAVASAFSNKAGADKAAGKMPKTGKMATPKRTTADAA